MGRNNLEINIPTPFRSFPEGTVFVPDEDKVQDDDLRRKFAGQSIPITVLLEDMIMIEYGDDQLAFSLEQGELKMPTVYEE